MIISVTCDPANPRDCRPADLLQQLLATDRLANFVNAAAVSDADGLGNCHETSVALMVDLKLAGRAAGWHWATGDTRHFASGGTRKHSWLEVEGWALDFLGDTLLFADRWWYRRFHHARNVKLRDVRATAHWLRKRAHKSHTSMSGAAMRQQQGRPVTELLLSLGVPQS